MNELLTVLDTKYKRLEYLESTGTQYIKTGIQTGTNIEVNCKFMAKTVDATYRIPCGARVSAQSNSISTGFSSAEGNKMYVSFGNNSEVSAISVVTNTIYEYTQNKNNFIINNESFLYKKGYTTNFTTPLEIYCFTRNVNGSASGFFIGRIYFLKIYDNGTLVRNFVPVLRKTDNEIGMLDLVEGKFYTNAGTGKFTANLDTMYAIIQGTPTVQDGRVSNFSTSNYLKTPVFSPQDKKWEMVWKFTTGTNVNSEGIITGLGTSDSIAPIYLRNTGELAFFISSNGTSWNIANAVQILPSVQPNTTYIIKLEFTGSSYNAYSFENGEWVLKNTVTSSNHIYGTLPLVIGNNRGNISANNFSGTIDLNRSYIKIDDTKYKLQAVVGYTVVGSPTITDGVVSGFSTSDYLTFLQGLSDITNLDTDILKLQWDFTLGADKTNIQTILSAGFFSISINNATITSWNPDENKFKVIIPANDTTINTHYIIRLIKNRKTFNFSYSKNGGAFINSLTYTRTGTLTNNSSEIGASPSNNRYFRGSMDFNNTYIKVNNKLWFNGLPNN